MSKRLSRLGRKTLQASGTGGAERLASSNGKVALIGLFTAVATLSFTVWMQVSLREHGEVRLPLAQTATHLEAAITRAVALTRGWVAHADDAALTERRAMWGQRVVPLVLRMQALSRQHSDADTVQRVEAMTADLRELERLLWVVEDAAHAPGNEPARVGYALEVSPILQSIQNIVEIHCRPHSQYVDPNILLMCANYRAAVIEIDRALLSLLDENSEVRRVQFGKAIARLEEPAKNLEVALAPIADTDFAQGLLHVLGEAKPLVVRSRAVAKVLDSEQWNLVAYTHRTKIAPLLDRIEADAERLVEEQQNSMEAAGEQIRGWGLVILALALLMGILSAGSLYVSVRVRYRMQQVLAKARKLGQYAIEERLGGGGMGEVYRATHATLRRPTAIKLLRARSATDFAAQERFREEVQLTSQLTHPNTIQVYDYGQTPEGLFYYAMELLEGVNLDLLVRVTGPLPPGRVAHLLLQICGSLREAHEKGLLHRDIKPANIMLTERGGVRDVAKVLDFGLVRRAGTSDDGEGLVGTPMFMAPELVTEHDRASPRSDIYALGGVAYYLLTGHYPFDTEDHAELLRMQIEQMPMRPAARLGRDLPEGLEAVVMSCLAKDPLERPESAEHLGTLVEAAAVEAWTDAEARLWWAEFGEALLAEATGPRSIAGDLASGLQVMRTRA